MTSFKCYLFSVLAGLALTAVLFVAYSEEFAPKLTGALLAPFLLIRDLVPPFNIGTPEIPVYESTPVHLTAGLVGLAVTATLYSVLAFLVVKRVQRPRR